MTEQETRPPISIDTLAECERSAQFWADNLPLYGAGLQTQADRYAIAAAIISAATGLSVWATLASSTHVWAQANAV